MIFAVASSIYLRLSSELNSGGDASDCVAEEASLNGGRVEAVRRLEAGCAGGIRGGGGGGPLVLRFVDGGDGGLLLSF